MTNGVTRASRKAVATGRRFADDRRAATAVEFSILCMPFFLLVFALLGTGAAFLGEFAMDNAVAKLGRQLTTGQASNSGMTEADFRQALCAETFSLFDCANLRIDVRSYAKFSDVPTGAPLSGSDNKKTLNTAGFGFETPKANTIMAIRVFYEWPIFISPLQAYFSQMNSGSYLIGSVGAFKTEPFDAN